VGIIKRYSLLGVAGVIVVVLVVLGLQGTGPMSQFLHDADPSATGPDEASDRPSDTTSTTVGLASRAYQAGDCVTWNQDVGAPGRRQTDVVGCDEAHLFEFTGSVLLDPSAFGPDGPTDAEWEVAIDRECPSLAADHLGYALDPAGRFEATAIMPLPESWRDGDHELQCGMGHVDVRVQPPGAARVLEAFTGRVAGADQTLLFGPGSCLGEFDTSGAVVVVDCAGPHLIEVVGAIELLGGAGAPYPGDAAVAAAIEESCVQAAEDAFDGAFPYDELGVGHFDMSESIWNSGGRVVECTVGRNGSGGEWQVVDGPILGTEEA
jgi:hypothetical protein